MSVEKNVKNTFMKFEKKENYVFLNTVDTECNTTIVSDEPVRRATSRTSFCRHM